MDNYYYQYYYFYSLLHVLLFPILLLLLQRGGGQMVGKGPKRSFVSLRNADGRCQCGLLTAASEITPHLCPLCTPTVMTNV